MKTIGIFSLLSMIIFKLSAKKILIGLLLLNLNTSAQTLPIANSWTADSSYFVYMFASGRSIPDSPKLLFIKDSSYMSIRLKTLYLDSLFNNTSSGNPDNLLWVNSSDKKIVYSSKDSLRLSWSQITNQPALTNGTVTSVGLTSTDFSVSGSPVTTSGNITANLNTSGISAGTYMGATFNSKGIATAGINPTIDTISASRSFNTAYQMSTTKYTDIRISVQISCALSLSGGNGGSVFLEWSADGSTNWTFAGQVPSSNTGTLTVGLNTVQIGGGQLTALIPPSYYWRVRTSNTSGTPTYTLLGGQKITY